MEIVKAMIHYTAVILVVTALAQGTDKNNDNNTGKHMRLVVYYHHIGLISMCLGHVPCSDWIVKSHLINSTGAWDMFQEPRVYILLTRPIGIRCTIHL